MKNKFAVTIGRQYGSGGHDIGKELAQQMGVSFYDRKLITESAKRSGLSDEIFEQREERMPGTLRYALTFGATFSPGFGAETLFKIQSETIQEIASRESCVIVGRSADYVLRDDPMCFNVFVHSPLEVRIGLVASRLGISRKEAADKIADIDKMRAAYYDFYTDKKWGDSMSYHISIDSSLLGIDGTVKYLRSLIEEAVKARK